MRGGQQVRAADRVAGGTLEMQTWPPASLSRLPFLLIAASYLLPAWQGDTPSVLGAGLDELMRHAVPLKKDGVETVIAIFQRLCVLGGERRPSTPAAV